MPMIYTATSSSTDSTTGVWENWNAITVTGSGAPTATAGTDICIWNGWVIDGTAAASTAITVTGASDAVWANWNAGSAITPPPNTAHAWNYWNTAEGARRATRLPMSYAERYAETDEAREARLAAQAERNAAWAKQREEAAAKRRAADKRAMDLLRECLTEQQRRDLKAHDYFFVDAPSGRRYRIDKGRAGNVKVIDKQTGVWTESLCVHPNGVPNGDTMLIQKMLIETAEETFRAYANITVKGGGYVYGKGGRLTGDELAEVISLDVARKEREAAAPSLLERARQIIAS